MRAAEATVSLADSTDKLVAMVWQDTVPVRYMSCGIPTTAITIEKLGKDGKVCTLRGTKVQHFYQVYMGGVDTNDNLRVLHYSLQKRLRLRRWHRAVSYGLIDLGLINRTSNT